MQYKNYYILSAAYGEGTYNTSTYVGDNGTSTTPGTGTGTGTTGTTGTSDTGGSTSGNSGSGALANTGLELLVAATIACAIVFVALVVRFSRRKAKI